MHNTNVLNSSSVVHSHQPVVAAFGSDVTVIDSFRGAFGFLSNFYESSIWCHGKQYRSVEHAYQAFKSSDEAIHETIRAARTPSIAKKLGKAVPLPQDWERKKVGIMHELVREKFKNPLLRSMLLATEDARLVEGNTWNDRFWGVCRGSGQNHLGRILMEVRDECKVEEG